MSSKFCFRPVFGIWNNEKCKSLIIYDTKLVFTFLCRKYVEIFAYLFCMVLYLSLSSNCFHFADRKQILWHWNSRIKNFEMSSYVWIIEKSRGYRILIITWRYQSWSRVISIPIVVSYVSAKLCFQRFIKKIFNFRQNSVLVKFRASLGKVTSNKPKLTFVLAN